MPLQIVHFLGRSSTDVYALFQSNLRVLILEYANLNQKNAIPSLNPPRLSTIAAADYLQAAILYPAFQIQWKICIADRILRIVI